VSSTTRVTHRLEASSSGESVRTDFEGHEWHRTVLMKQSIVALGQARQDLGANSRHVTPLHAQGSGGEATLRDVRPAGKPKLHDDAGPAFAEHARAHLGSDYAARRVDCGQVDPEGAPTRRRSAPKNERPSPARPRDTMAASAFDRAARSPRRQHGCARETTHHEGPPRAGKVTVTIAAMMKKWLRLGLRRRASELRLRRQTG
jgi:hypothetical protein